jgi:hypothetical protein
MKNTLRSDFHIAEQSQDYVYIIDDCDGSTMSVTNDAEAVIESLFHSADLGDRRVFYKDTDGSVDELVHQGATFTGFNEGTDDYCFD